MRRLRRRLDALDQSGEAGFSMIELVVSMSILLIVSLMAIAILLSTQQASKLITWQSNANTELRQFVDATIADLQTARPRALCYDTDGKSRADMPASCPVDQIREGEGSPVESAGSKHVCYFTYRVDPAVFSGSTGTSNAYNYRRTCLAIIGSKLYTASWAANPTDLNNPVSTTASYHVLGDVDPANSSFRYFGDTFDPSTGVMTSGQLAFGSTATATVLLADPASPTGGAMSDLVVAKTDHSSGPLAGRVTGLINAISRVSVKIAVRTKSGNHTRDLSYDVTLRGAVFNGERCYTGEKKVVDVNGTAECQ